MRPGIDQITNGDELKRWYWRKDELVPYARAIGVKTTGGKFTILDRIAHYLDTGETTFPGDKQKRARSKFDWKTETLSLDTVITDNYKNTENTRRFFKCCLGDNFKFNIAFMEWMKSNEGKTLGDACDAYREVREAARKPGYQTRIKDHNQFNQYTRDFLADNPDLGIDDVRQAWAEKIKKQSDSGRHVYNPADVVVKNGA